LSGVISLEGILNGYGLDGKPKMLLKPEPASSGVSRGLLVGLGSAAVVLMLVIGFLNNHYQVVHQSRARELYEAGNELLRQGRPADAVQQYRNALSASTQNLDYRLALGTALVDADNPTEADIYLLPLLKTQPNDGRTNLALARSAAQQGNLDEAEQYYHHAIYGSWPNKLLDQAVKARFELVTYLEKSGAKTQAVAELLAIPQQAPKNTAALLNAADRLMKLGSPKQAVEVYQAVLHHDDRNAEAYEGLGQAQLAQGDYKDAIEPLRNAVKFNPGDSAAQTRLQNAEQVIALNPLARGVSSADRYHRTELILQRAVRDLESCVSIDRASANLGPAQKLANEARQIIARGRASGNDSIDHNISLAEQLRDQRKSLCSLGGSEDEVLDQVLALLARP
jgi:tetratricopeptide (TPR) repeat protein